MKVHYGRFLPKTKRRPLAAVPSQFVEVLDTEEKGSDVNLASHLLHDAWRDLYDAALVLSQDTDLCEPLRMVSRDLKKPVGLVWLDGREPGRRFQSCTTFIRHATPARLCAAQFADELRNRKGHVIVRPAAW